MKVKDFLENFKGTNHIKIFIRNGFNYETLRYNSTQKAISDVGHYTIKYWTIESNVLEVTV